MRCEIDHRDQKDNMMGKYEGKSFQLSLSVSTRTPMLLPKCSSPNTNMDMTN
jgi:hypothetical protein